MPDTGLRQDSNDLLFFLSESDPDFGGADRAEGLLISPGTEITAAASAPQSLTVDLPCEQAEPGTKRSVDEVDALKRELDRLRQLASQLTGEYSTLQQALHEADVRSATVLETVRDIGQRVGSLDVFVDISRNTDQRLADLNVLADDVTRKLQALDGQRNTIEHALIEANRLADILSAMDTRIARLKETDQRAVRTERMLGRLQRRVAETAGLLHERANAMGSIGAVEHSIPIQNPKAETLTSASRITHWSWAPHRRYRLAVIGGLAVFALGFIVTRSGGNARQIGGDPGAQARPALNARAVVWTGRLPDSAQRQTQTARIVTARASLKAPPRDLARPRGFTGTLAIESNPRGAAVFIDRQHVGDTPLQLLRSRAGSHAVWIEHQGYQRWTAAVLVPADKLTRVSATLYPDLASR